MSFNVTTVPQPVSFKQKRAEKILVDTYAVTMSPFMMHPLNDTTVSEIKKSFEANVANIKGAYVIKVEAYGVYDKAIGDVVVVAHYRLSSDSLSTTHEIAVSLT